MTNTTELRERFDKKFLSHDGLFQKAERKWEDYCAKTNGFVPHFWCSRFFPSDDILKFTQSEIEAAEKAKVEEVIEAAHQWFDPSSPEHHMAKIGSRLKKFLMRKFLTNPER